MSVRKSKQQKKQAPQKCGATERLTVAVTRPEDEEDYSEMEKKVAAKYGLEINTKPVIWEIILRDFWCDILRVSHANPITNVSRTL
jgi:hypothetical protein